MSNILESSWSPSFASCFASASTVNPPDPTRTRTKRHYKNTNRKALQEHKQKGTTRTQTERHYKNTNRKALQEHEQKGTTRTQTERHYKNTNRKALQEHEQKGTTRTQTERHYKNTNRKALQEHRQKGTTRTRTERHYKNTDRKAESINKEKLTLVSKVVETKEEFQLYYLLAFSFSAQIVCVFFKFYTVIGHLSKQFAYKKARAPKDTGKVGVNGIGSEAALD